VHYATLLCLVVVSWWVLGCAATARDSQTFSFTTQGIAVFQHPDVEDPPLSPEERRCIDRRLAPLRQLGGQYQQVLATMEQLGLSNRLQSAALVCFQPEAAVLPALDQASLVLFYHEVVHFLSSAGDRIRLARTQPPGTSAWEAFHEPFYRYYVAEEASPHLWLPYVPGTLPMHALYEQLQAQPGLEKRERYFATANENNWYVLLEEWNAYNASLDLAVALVTHGLAPCAPTHTSDAANAAMEFAFYTATYLDALQRQQPALFTTLLQAEAVREFLRFQQEKTQRLVTAADRYPCLFNRLTPQLRPVFDDASRRLRALVGTR
jgi:hypothetical protein